MKRITAFVIFVLAGILVLSALVVVAGNGGVATVSDVKSEGNTRTLSSHSPIYINGNAAFATQAGSEGWSGNGTTGAPYIIENYDINATDAHGIYIRNTDVYFVIRNCVVHDGKSNYSHGIYFDNTTNGKIENCEIYNNYYGIYLYYSSNNNITNCAVYNNSGLGIYLSSSSNNNIITNSYVYNNYYGIILYSSSNNTITNCAVYNNYEAGIDLQSSSNNNNITNCNAYNNSYYGIRLYDSSNNNNITNCTVYDNSDDGIYLWYSSNNNITNCYIYNNYVVGISLCSSSNNQISNCTAYSNSNCSIGLYSSSTENQITNCTVYNNSYGIFLDSSSNNNQITYCNITDNTYCGVCIRYDASYPSNYNLFHHNNFINNTQNAHDECTNSWDNGIEGNYWGDYTGGDAIANFTYSPANPTDLDTVEFTDLSEGGNGIGNTPYNISGGSNQDRYPLMRPVEEGVHATTIVSWEWSFGDGNTSSLQNPTHQYFYGGTYCVSLNVTDTEGAFEGCQKDITIQPTHLSPHDPISINGNSDFTEANGVTDGNGTENNPYIIENWDIDAGWGIGIYIGNTEVYFIIRNCMIHNVNVSIYFYNVTNGKIENCEIYDNCDYGIELDYSSNNQITNCTVYNNPWIGIKLSSSSNNQITNCTIYNCNVYDNSYGIYLWSSSNNNITNCTVYNNIDYGAVYAGIYLYYSYNNTISNCYVYNASDDGIRLDYSSNNNIVNCNVYNNSGRGIRLSSSSNNNNITNCNVYNNNGDGIHLFDFSDNNQITNCDVYNNSYCGIWLGSSSNNNITNCNVYNNSESGISLDSSNNTVTNCSVYNNSLYGIYLYSSSDNLIYNNYLNNANNVYISGGSNNKWNISKTPGTNIIGDSYLGGNYWSDYTGCDMDGDGLGDTNLPYGPGDYLPLTATNFKPVANFTWSPLTPTDLETVQFTSTSTDPDGDPLTYSWYCNDISISTSQSFAYLFPDNGVYTVSLTVTDSHGASNITSKQITVLNVAPVANFTFPSEIQTNMSVSFNAYSSYDLDGTIVSFYMEFGDGTSTEQTGVNLGHLYLKAGLYQVNLTVTDNDGATNTTSMQITVVWETTMSVSLSVDQAYHQVNVVWPWENITVTFNATLYVTCYYSTVTEINISGENESLTLSPVGVNWTASVFPANISLSEGANQIPVVINITLTQGISNQLLYREWYFCGGVVGTTKIVDTPQYYASFKSIISVRVTTLLSNSTDYDSDGIPDAAEVWLGLNPANSSDALLDPDSDGWDNLHEYLNGTDMHNWDTDTDGLSDAFEIIFSKTNPLLGDTNGNGLSDGLEFLQNQGYSGNMEVLPNGWIGMTITCANSTIYAETNSSVLEGRYNKDKKTLRIKIHGPPETIGVANITIPKDMVDSEKDIKIQLDGHLINYTLSQNTTHYFIHIEYTHSTHELAARFTPVSGIALNNPVNLTKDSLALSWDACLSPEFAKYEIYQSTVSGTPGSLITTITDPAVVSYTVTDLSPDTIYYFTVRVVYNDGFYADSDQMFEKTSAIQQLIVVVDVVVDGKQVNVTYNGTGNLSVGNASISEIEVLKEKIPSDKKHIGIFVEINITGVLKEAFITIRYDNSDVAGIDESKLMMYYWNETANEWVLIEDSGVWTNNNTAWARITHFTIFAPMAEKTAAGKKVAPVSLLSYIIIFAVAILLISAGIGVKKMKKQKPTAVKCPKCDENIKVTSTERPVEIVCPKCGAKGALK